jgi:5-methylthioadenosine/S-adenosylhomocysteine deaminase
MDRHTANTFDLLITNATAILGGPDPYEVVPRTTIGVAGGQIVQIEPSPDAAGMNAKATIDAHGMIAFPGLINTHTHLFQTLTKGLGDEMYPIPWGKAVTRPTASALDPDEAYFGAMLGCLEAIRSGTTSILEFAYPHPDDAIYHAIFKAFDDSGIRGFVGRGIRELDPDNVGFDSWSLPFDEIFDQIRRLSAAYPSGLGVPSVMPAPSTVRTMSPTGFLQVRDFALSQGMRMTIHINEISEERDDSLARWGVGSFPKLEEIGFLGPEVIAVHCVKLDSNDVDILARTGTQVSYNPVSNFYLGNGIAPVVEMLDKGVGVSLGTDGAASNNSQDMIEALKFGALAQKGAACDPRVISARDLLRIATVGGATALGVADQLGSISVGRRADLFLFDPYRLKSVPVHDPISSLVYSAGTQNVDTVIVEGKVVLRDGRFSQVDESAFLREVQERALALSRRSGTDYLVKQRSSGRVPQAV